MIFLGFVKGRIRSLGVEFLVLGEIRYFWLVVMFAGVILREEVEKFVFFGEGFLGIF